MLICQGVRVDMTRCSNRPTQTVHVSGVGRADDSYVACDGCAAMVSECDGVTTEPL